MIATEYRLIPLAQLVKHEDAVLRGLRELPVEYLPSLMETSQTRYPFLYYALLTHWPELLGGGLLESDRIFNQLYWFERLSKVHQRIHGKDSGFDEQTSRLLEDATSEVEAALEARVKVNAEFASNEWEIPVSFSSFSIAKAVSSLNLQFDESGDYFAKIATIPISPLLQEILRENTPLALAIGTEKARSEFIIAPVLSEVRRQLSNAISLFSGVEITIDPAQGLRGEFDFLLCKSPHQMFVQTPIIAVVEAKKEDMAAGTGQCLAEMVGARIFNQQNNTSVPVLYGIVTTGSNWRFLRLIDNTAYVDATEYYIADVERIVGIVISMFTSSGVPHKGIV